MEKGVNPPNKTDEHFNISELSEYLRGRSSGAIRNLVLRRKIPFRKVCGRVIFLKKEIDQWIEKSPGISYEEISNNE
jgi:hypothetical protein